MSQIDDARGGETVTRTAEAVERAAEALHKWESGKDSVLWEDEEEHTRDQTRDAVRTVARALFDSLRLDLDEPAPQRIDEVDEMSRAQPLPGLLLWPDPPVLRKRSMDRAASRVIERASKEDPK